MAVVYGAPHLNEVGQRRWREFARQDYFDRQGLFMTMLVCLPLVLVSLFVLLNGMVLVSGLLVDVKRLQAQRAQRAKAREDKKKK